MPNFYTRATRDYDFVPGQGSSLVIAQYSALRVLEDPFTLDIEQGTIRETYINQDTTHSGSPGSKLYTRTGFDWVAALVLSFPATDGNGDPLREEFLQNLLGSGRSVAVQFFIGDPEFWRRRVLKVRSYVAPRALMGPCETRLDSTGTQVVGLNATLQGNSGLVYTLSD